MSSFSKRQLVKKSENIADWYQDVILQTGIAEYAPVKGFIVIKPYGYALWEKIQEKFNQFLKEDEIGNTYFPVLIPQSFLAKEKEHVEGFSPELAVVTIGGGEKLAEPLVVRPTSETIMYSAFSKWISSWRDLPLKINQWCNIVRWEKRTYFFLRGREFLWQEGHTAHVEELEAMEMVKKALEWYRKIHEELLAIPVISGRKSNSEKFAGAKETYAIEGLMPGGKALQIATSHNLGQNFSKVFEVKFQDKNGESQYVWQTSWGSSTRSLGPLILVHGDDNGLVMPPKMAPIQVVVIAITEEAKNYASEIVTELKKAGTRVKLDQDFEHSLGWRINDWEMKGIPIRLEIGKKELENEEMTIVRRDNNSKIKDQRSKLKLKIQNLLEEMQTQMFQKAKRFLEENISVVNTYEEFKKIMETKRGFIKAFWCEDPKCEAKIKEETKATTRVLPFDTPKEKGKCIYCGKEANYRWYFAQAY